MKLIDTIIYLAWGFPNDSVITKQPVNAEDAGDVGSIPGLGTFPEGGHGNPLQYYCQKIPWTRSLVGYIPWSCKESDMTGHTCMHILLEIFLIIYLS